MLRRKFILVGFAALCFIVASGCFESLSKTETPSETIDQTSDSTTRTTDLILEEKFTHPLLTQGDSLLKLGQPQNALSRFRKAITAFENHDKNDGRILALIGSLKAMAADNSEDEYDHGISELNDLAGKNRHSYRCREYINEFYGSYYFDQNDGYGKMSLEAYEKLLDVRIKLYGDTSRLVAETYSSIGKVNRYQLSNYSEARIALEKGLEIFNSLENPPERKLFYNYYWLASTYNKIGDYANAETIANKAFKLAKQLPEPNVAEVSRGLIILGLIKSDLLQWEAAIDYYLQLAELEESFGSDLRRSDFIYNNLGGNYLELGLYDEAKVALKKSLAINEKTGSYSSLRLTLRNLGALSFMTDDLKSAMYYYRHALEINETHIPEDRLQIAHFQHSIGGIFAKMNKPDSAMYHYQKALQHGFEDFRVNDTRQNPHITRTDNNHELFNILGSKAKLHQDLFRKDPTKTEELHYALECYLKADSVIMMNRASFDHETSKLNMASANYRDVYADAIECVFLLNSIYEDPEYRAYAFLFMEKNKSMILFEALSKNNQVNETGIDPLLRKQELELIESVTINEHKKKTLNHELSGAVADSLSVEAINELKLAIDEENEKSIDLHQKGEELKKALKLKEPEYYNQKYGGEFHDLTTTARLLNKPNRAVIEFFQTEEAIYSLVFKDGHSNLEKIDIDEELRSAISTYQRILRDGALIGPKVDAEFLEFKWASWLLYQKFLGGPFELLGGSPDNLLVILDPSMGNFPIEALIQKEYSSDKVNYKKLNYLVRDVEVCYAFSANVFVQNITSSNQKEKVRPDVVGFSYLKTEDIGALPGAGKETGLIKKIMGGKFFDGPLATKTSFKKEVRNKNLIHLSIHGSGDTTSTYGSFLHFVNDSNEKEARLFAYDLYSLDLDAQLVVLSACESGVGAAAKGEGVYSIARGFAFAGCPTQVITFWKISDNAAVDIMDVFYRKLAMKSSVGSSLMAAKNKFIDEADPYRAHPKNWAAFIVLGNADLSFKKPGRQNCLF